MENPEDRFIYANMSEVSAGTEGFRQASRFQRVLDAIGAPIRVAWGGINLAGKMSLAAIGALHDVGQLLSIIRDPEIKSQIELAAGEQIERIRATQIDDQPFAEIVFREPKKK